MENQEPLFVVWGIDAPVGMKSKTSGFGCYMFNAICCSKQANLPLSHGQEVETSGNPLACYPPWSSQREWQYYAENYL